MKWYSIPTFKKWVRGIALWPSKTRFAALRAWLWLGRRDKIRILARLAIVASIFFIVFPSLKTYFLARADLGQAISLEHFASQCGFEWSCTKGYNFDCYGIPNLVAIETDEEKWQREAFYQRQETLIKVCRAKGLWPE